jgi:hypothetical protein
LSTLIKLDCASCDNPSCPFCPQGTYVPYAEDKKGCTKKVNEDLYVQYEYLTEELKYSHDVSYKYLQYLLKEMLNTLIQIYNAPTIKTRYLQNLEK